MRGAVVNINKIKNHLQFSDEAKEMNKIEERKKKENVYVKEVYFFIKSHSSLYTHIPFVNARKEPETLAVENINR